MARIFFTIISAILTICYAFPQKWSEGPGAKAQKPLRFEVASIRLNKSDSESARLRYRRGRFVAVNLPLYTIIAEGYGVSYLSPRLSGGPGWVHSEKYDIEATIPSTAFPAGVPFRVLQERTRSMLRTLLAERFKLTVRQQRKEMLVYALTVGRGGPKLQKAKVQENDCLAPSGDAAPPCHRISGNPSRGIAGFGVDMSDVLPIVEFWTGRPAIDRTGIKGLYDIKTGPWRPLQAVQTSDDFPTFFMLFEKLGLHLRTQKALIDGFVIEHVERPSEN